MTKYTHVVYPIEGSDPRLNALLERSIGWAEKLNTATVARSFIEAGERMSVSEKHDPQTYTVIGSGAKPPVTIPRPTPTKITRALWAAFDPTFARSIK